MTRKVDLTSETVTRQQRKNRTLGTQTPLASTTVERGSTHWTDGSNVNIDGLLGIAGTGTVTGYLGVTGVLDVTGTLNASGQINLSGSTDITGPLNVTGATTIGGNTNITGELNVTGPTTLDGILDIGGDTKITGVLDVQGDTTMSGKLDVTGPMATKGTLSVEGKTTLKNDLTVEAGGKIKVGGLMIEPAVGGQINFVGGAITSDTTFGMLMNHSSKVELSAPEVLLGGTSTKAGGTMEVMGRLTARERLVLPNTPNTANSSFVPNMHIDSNGFVWRTTWAPA